MEVVVVIPSQPAQWWRQTKKKGEMGKRAGERGRASHHRDLGVTAGVHELGTVCGGG
jgi:hypothetical protein